MRDVANRRVRYCGRNLEKCGKGVRFGNDLKWYLEVETWEGCNSSGFVVFQTTALVYFVSRIFLSSLHSRWSLSISVQFIIVYSPIIFSSGGGSMASWTTDCAELCSDPKVWKQQGAELNSHASLNSVVTALTIFFFHLVVTSWFLPTISSSK